MNKTEVNKLLVAERKSMREKAKNSLFMRRTLSIYNGMKKRAADNNSSVTFDIEQFRIYANEAVGWACPYCGKPMTVKSMCPDHRIPIARGGNFSFANIEIICQSCNWQKGQLTRNEFSLLLGLLSGMEKEAQTDVKRRLTIGGRWSWK